MQPAEPSLLAQYGVIGLIAAIFASVIVVLFKQLRAEAAARIEDHKSIAKEREKAAVDQERLRTEFEGRLRTVVESYAQAAKLERAENREHEDEVRREFAELMEKVSAESGKASDALTAMLQKFYDRLVGPARGRH